MLLAIAQAHFVAGQVQPGAAAVHIAAGQGAASSRAMNTGRSSCGRQGVATQAVAVGTEFVRLFVEAPQAGEQLLDQGEPAPRRTTSPRRARTSTTSSGSRQCSRGRLKDCTRRCGSRPFSAAPSKAGSASRLSGAAPEAVPDVPAFVGCAPARRRRAPARRQGCAAPTGRAAPGGRHAGPGSARSAPVGRRRGGQAPVVRLEQGQAPGDVLRPGAGAPGSSG